MTYVQAINLLDRRRAGADMPASLVDRALELTGDIEPDETDSIITEGTV